jgi:hypothetical protein
LLAVVELVSRVLRVLGAQAVVQAVRERWGTVQMMTMQVAAQADQVRASQKASSQHRILPGRSYRQTPAGGASSVRPWVIAVEVQAVQVTAERLGVLHLVR